MANFMQQYRDAKSTHPDMLLLFRMGDFYELFEKDAETATKVLYLTLTKRSWSNGETWLMAGFPHHSLEKHLHALLMAGYRVAICEEVQPQEKPKKKPKNREVVRVVTPSELQHASIHPAALAAPRGCTA